MSNLPNEDCYETNKNSTTNHLSFWRSLVGGMLGTILVLGFFIFVSGGVNDAFMQENKNEPKVTQQSVQGSKTLTDFETAILGAVETTKGAVVSIGNLQEPFGQSMGFESYSEQDGGLKVAGEGSGVIYKIEGDKAYVITNNHVIDGNEALQVIFADGQKVEADLVGSDVVTDLAVLTIDAKYATNTIQFADSDKIKVGSLAIAIGSPLGSDFASSVTQGIVSGLNRSMPTDANGDGQVDWEATVLQTDAAINPGNSGGALVNKNGELIGINSSKFSSTDIEGMGFAIPSNEVKAIVDQLEKNGEVLRPFLGVATVDVEILSNKDRFETLQLPENQETGVAVRHVEDGSPADKAGIEVYDVITEINGEKVKNVANLRNKLYQHKAGDQIKVTYLRQGKKAYADVTLQEPK